MEKTGRTREKNKDAMVLFLYKSHLYKDGMLILSNLENLPSSNTLWKLPSFCQYGSSKNQTTNNRVYRQQSREMDHSYFKK